VGGCFCCLFYFLFNEVSLLKRAGSVLTYTDKSEKEHKDSVHKEKFVQCK